MSFLTYCFRWEKKVTANTLFVGRSEVIGEFGKRHDVEVMHTESSVHRWKLNRKEKAKLLNHIRKSLYDS
jgi:hypothetical protein